MQNTDGATAPVPVTTGEGAPGPTAAANDDIRPEPLPPGTADPSGLSLDVFHAERVTATTWTAGCMPWPRIVVRLREKFDAGEDVAKDGAGAYVLGAFEGTRRTGDAVRSRGALALDLDGAKGGDTLDEPAAFEHVAASLDGIEHVAHTTHRSTPEHARVRIVIPLADPVAPSDYRAASRIVIRRLGLAIMDPSCDEPARAMYFPARPAGAVGRFEHARGAALDARALIDAEGEGAAADGGGEGGPGWIDPRTFAGIEGAVCRVLDVDGALGFSSRWSDRSTSRDDPRRLLDGANVGEVYGPLRFHCFDTDAPASGPMNPWECLLYYADVPGAELPERVEGQAKPESCATGSARWAVVEAWARELPEVKAELEREAEEIAAAFARVGVPDGAWFPEGEGFTLRPGDDPDGRDARIVAAVKGRGRNAPPVTVEVSGPVWHEFASQNAARDGERVHVGFVDRHGSRGATDFPLALLYGRPGDLAKHFADRGVFVNVEAVPHLARYLQHLRPGVARRLNVDRPGWHTTPDGAPAFVLPERAIGAVAESIALAGSEAAARRFGEAGTVADWRDTVGALCVGNSRMLLSVSFAFAAPLLDVCGVLTGGGLHWRGATTAGKTTTVRAAVSVYGPPARLVSWNTTATALETIAAEHSDTLLVLDEIKEFSGANIGDVLYMLGNGEGRVRGRPDGSARPVRRWRSLYLSTGEIDAATLQRAHGDAEHGGQAVRFVAVPARAGAHGAFEELHGSPSGRAFATRIEEAVAGAYGAVGVRWLERLVVEREAVSARWGAFLAAFEARAGIGTGDGAAARVARLFALAAFGGTLATEWGLTGWPAGTATDAALAVFGEWREGEGGRAANADAKAVERVGAFLAENRDRLPWIEPSGFAGPDDDEHETRERGAVTQAVLGYAKRIAGVGVVYGILPEVWSREVCRGLQSDDVLDAIDRAGFLHVTDGERREGRKQHRMRVPSARVIGQEAAERYPRERVYAIRAAVLDAGASLSRDDVEHPDYEW